MVVFTGLVFLRIGTSGELKMTSKRVNLPMQKQEPLLKTSKKNQIISYYSYYRYYSYYTIDLTKDFDVIYHKLLLLLLQHKLNLCGLRGNINSCMSSYLTGKLNLWKYSKQTRTLQI
jgi:hypothetical protein